MSAEARHRDALTRDPPLLRAHTPGDTPPAPAREGPRLGGSGE